MCHTEQNRIGRPFREKDMAKGIAPMMSNVKAQRRKWKLSRGKRAPVLVSVY